MVEHEHTRPFGMMGSMRNRYFLGVGVVLVPLATLVVISYFFLANSLRSLDGVIIHLFDDLQIMAELQRQTRQIPEIYRQERTSVDGPNEAVTMLVRDVDSLFSNVMVSSTANANDKESLNNAHLTWLSLRGALLSPAMNQSESKPSANIDTLTFAMLRHIMIFEASVYNTIRTDLYNTLQGRKDTQLVITALAFFSLLVAVTSGVLLYRSMFDPLRRMRMSTERIMAGDLEHRVETGDTGELGRLAESFNAMTGMLLSNQTRIRMHTIHDSLTGLINRREFKTRFGTELERALRYSQPFALLMVDVDDFSEINEKYGHVAGDEALRVVAVTLSREVRPMDIVARFDDDEFAVIMPDIGTDDALSSAERLREHISKQEFVIANGTKPVKFTVSIGLVLFPDDGDEIELLMSRVNVALAEAKVTGGNVVRAATLREDPMPRIPSSRSQGN